MKDHDLEINADLYFRPATGPCIRILSDSKTNAQKLNAITMDGKNCLLNIKSYWSITKHVFATSNELKIYILTSSPFHRTSSSLIRTVSKIFENENLNRDGTPIIRASFNVSATGTRLSLVLRDSKLAHILCSTTLHLSDDITVKFQIAQLRNQKRKNRNNAGYTPVTHKPFQSMGTTSTTLVRDNEAKAESKAYDQSVESDCLELADATGSQELLRN